MRAIEIDDFRMFHPDMVAFKTDLYYNNLANVLFDIIGKTQVGREIDREMRESIALMVSHYFEDVVCDLGIWRSFVEMHMKRYARPLPFYSVDVDDYYPDEIHLEDVQFLVWNVMQSAFEDQFMNPENLGFEEVAKAIYAELDKRFEQAPVNEQYRIFAYEMVKADHPDAPFLLRNIWMWLLTKNYLTTTDKAEDEMSQYQEKVAKIDPRAEASYCAMSYASVKVKIGPMNVTAPEWFIAMCEGEESDNAQLLAKKIKAMDYREMSIYKVFDCQRDCVKIESPSGEVLSVPYSGFTEPNAVKITAMKTTTFTGALLLWDNVWMPFGQTAWGKQDKAFALMKSKHESNMRTAELVPAKVREKYGDKCLFFLKDKSQIGEWNRQLHGIDVPMSNGSNAYNEIPAAVPIAMYLDAMGDFCLAPTACAIKSADNPYYDKKDASELGLGMLMLPWVMDESFLDYLVDNNLLPDASCNSIYGEEHGRELIQSNIHFLKEYFRGIR